MANKQHKPNSPLTGVAVSLLFACYSTASGIAQAEIGPSKTFTDAFSIALINTPFVPFKSDFQTHLEARIGCTKLLNRNAQSYRLAMNDVSGVAQDLKSIYNYSTEYQLRSFCEDMADRSFYMPAMQSIQDFRR